MLFRDYSGVRESDHETAFGKMSRNKALDNEAVISQGGGIGDSFISFFIFNFYIF